MNLKRIDSEVIIDIDKIVSAKKEQVGSRFKTEILFAGCEDYEYFDFTIDELEKAIKEQ